MFWNFDQTWLLDPQNQNSYSYARNNPINLKDPSGQSWATFGQGLASPFVYAYYHPLETALIVGSTIALATVAPVAVAVVGVALGGYAIGSSLANAYYAPDADTRDYYLGEGAMATAFTVAGIKAGGKVSGMGKAGKMIGVEARVAGEAGSLARMESILKPGGRLIGTQGTKSGIRVVSGGLSDAEIMFKQLTEGMTPVQKTGYNGIKAAESANGDFIGLRTIHGNSPNTAATIDINVNGIEKLKIKFNP